MGRVLYEKDLDGFNLAVQALSALEVACKGVRVGNTEKLCKHGFSVCPHANQ